MLASAPATANNQEQVAICAWPLKTTVDTLNVAFPDASATYWTTPFTVLPNLTEIILDGEYTEARYISVDVYNNSGSSFSCGGRESGLVLQLGFMGGASLPMATSRALLMAAAPAGPGERMGEVGWPVPDEVAEQAAQLGDGERQERGGQVRPGLLPRPRSCAGRRDRRAPAWPG